MRDQEQTKDRQTRGGIMMVSLPNRCSPSSARSIWWNTLVGWCARVEQFDPKVICIVRFDLRHGMRFLFFHCIGIEDDQRGDSVRCGVGHLIETSREKTRAQGGADGRLECDLDAVAEPGGEMGLSPLWENFLIRQFLWWTLYGSF